MALQTRRSKEQAQNVTYPVLPSWEDMTKVTRESLAEAMEEGKYEHLGSYCKHEIAWVEGDWKLVENKEGVSREYGIFRPLPDLLRAALDHSKEDGILRDDILTILKFNHLDIISFVA
eukprot:CAMPEP_0184332018 /NCGR_PEP_ID=MMETSP1089-20130417/1293_1 /TAXON_ID=38269 ORGANISM="Gloeochaete wittrockiana, Strain SAG46.84" /NCGR_SAMPLE_ID=MMETSP1089 /ASSEMBLY_ACC=CAM_ASM_000445 /LENGTH=117 /DNA_ID=CAMNT_0026655219 /DNA_START=64 /DNA_END=413 /DNA_ORIENTATION=+